MKLLREKPIPLAQVVSLLQERKKQAKGGELAYEQSNTLEYAQKFAELTEKQSAALVKELQEKGLSEKQAIKVTDLLPKKTDELKAVLAAEKTDLSEEQLKEILRVIKEARK